MARFQRFRNAYSNRGAYYAKARSYGSKAYAKSGLNLSPAFIAGAVGSFAVPMAGINTSGLIDTAIIAGATAPVKGLGQAKGACQGYLFGKVIQSFIGNPLTSSAGNGGTNVI